MTLKKQTKTSKNISSNDNVVNDNGNVINIADIQSTIQKLNTTIFFEELREDCLIQSVKEDIKSVLKLLGGMREELAKANVPDADCKIGERLTTAKDYEKFYSDVLKELEE